MCLCVCVSFVCVRCDGLGRDNLHQQFAAAGDDENARRREQGFLQELKDVDVGVRGSCVSMYHPPSTLSFSFLTLCVRL